MAPHDEDTSGTGSSKGRWLLAGAAVVVLAAAGVGFYLYRQHVGGGPDPNNPYVQAALPAGYQPALKIPLPKMPPGDFKRVLYPSAPSPFVLVKTDLWDVKAGKQLGTVSYQVGPNTAKALTADGKHLALDRDGAVEVVALPAGAAVLRVPYDKGKGNLGFLDFAGPGRVVVGHPDGKVEVRPLAGGGEAKTFPAERFMPNGAAVSPDGKRLAHFGVDKLTIYDLESGKAAGEWSAPRGKFKGLLVASGVGFSPDGKEVAALFNSGDTQLILCWDAATGTLSGEFPVGPVLLTPGAGGIGYQGPVLQWLPEGAGWLLNGHVLYHRPSKRVVWILRTRHPFVHTVGLLDRDHVLAPYREGETESLVSVPIPWSQLDPALKDLQKPDPAPLRPGQAVTVQVDVSSLRLGNPQQVEADLRQVLTDRLARDGIRVADGQPTVVYGKYQEVAGATLKVYEWGMMRPQRDTGRTAEETKMALEVGIRGGADKGTLWRTYLSQGAGLIVSGQGTTLDVHRDTFERLKGAIKGVPFPYFIPADARTARLPLVSQL